MDDSFTVTNGTVEYHRQKRPMDFEHITPKVTLSFTVAAGADPLLVTGKVMRMAHQVVEAALEKLIYPAEAPVVQHEVEPKKGKRAASPSVPSPAPAAVTGQGAASTSTPNAASIEDDAGPTALTSDAPAPGASAQASSVASIEDMSGVDAEDEDAELLGLTRDEPAPAEVTDKDLQEKVARPLSAKLRENGGNVNRLRALIQAAGGGTVLTAIPQANRPGFMEKAKALLASL